MENPEDLLRRYQPAGPPPDLRHRITSAVRSGRSWTVREWLPAIGAAAAAMVFYVLASGARTDLRSATWPAGDAHEATVNELAQALGGDDGAREEAERIVWLDEMRSQEADAIAPQDTVVP